MPNFIALAIYFLFGTKFSWNEGIDVCFNVECVILDHNFDFIGGYLVVTAHFIGGYWLLLITRWLLLVTGDSDRYCLLLFIPTFGVNV